MNYALFVFDKATNVITEELFAPSAIRNWYALQGLKIDRVLPNPATETAGKRKFDLYDTYGKKWECKDDRMAAMTGNVFIEHRTLQDTEADYFLIFALGQAVVIPTDILKDLLASGQYQSKHSHRDPSLPLEGTLIPFNELVNYGELVQVNF